jgi:hypothetical protein
MVAKLAIYQIFVIIVPAFMTLSQCSNVLTFLNKQTVDLKFENVD